MVEVKESELPAIGKKFTVDTESGETLVVVVRLSGEREIYRFLEDKELPASVTDLTEEEARAIGSILVGAYFQPVPEKKTIELIMKELSMEWVKVEPGSILADKTIGQLGIRKKTGVSIISILREGKVIPNPLPTRRILEGDTLIVVGNTRQMEKFMDFIGGPKEG